jgi:hypothetical protein
MNWLFHKTLDLLKSLLSALGGLFTSAVDAETGIFDAFFKMQDDVHAFVANLKQFERFDFDPQWKTRVISLPAAWDSIFDLVDIIFHGFRDKFTELEHSLRVLGNVLKQSGTRQPEEGPSGIANVQEKLTTIKLAVVEFEQAFHAALELEEMALNVKNRLETLDDLFLPQGSSKTTVDIKYRKRNA